MLGIPTIVWVIIGFIGGAIIAAYRYSAQCKAAGEPDQTWQDVKFAWGIGPDIRGDKIRADEAAENLRLLGKK